MHKDSKSRLNLFPLNEQRFNWSNTNKGNNNEQFKTKKMNTKKIMLDYLSNKTNSKEIAEITGKDHKEVIKVLRAFSQDWENTQHDTHNAMSLKENELIERYAKRIDNL